MNLRLQAGGCRARCQSAELSPNIEADSAGATDLNFISVDRGYLFIAGLTATGVLLIFLSLVINARVAHNVQADLRHREKLLEYYRNTISQLGVILIGIGVSLSVFYFQQGYQERSRRNAEVQQILAKMSLQAARTAAEMPSLGEFDSLLDQDRPYQDPDTGDTHSADRLTGRVLADQIARIKLIEVDVNPRDLELMNISQIFENSFAVNEIDAALWFNIVRDESNIHYAVAQLASDYRDLHQALGDATPEAAAADPQRAAAVKREILDIYYDTDLLRQSGRRQLARLCWLLSAGPGFTRLTPVDEIEADQPTHQAWLARAKPVLQRFKVGSANCFEILGYRPD